VPFLPRGPLAASRNCNGKGDIREQKAVRADPVELGKAFGWLAAQPAIVDTIAREGWISKFAPEKVTMYPQGIVARQE